MQGISSIVKIHNDIFYKIGSIKTYSEALAVSREIRNFKKEYGNIVPEDYKRLSEKFMSRIEALKEQSNKEYNNKHEQFISEKNKIYDYANEPDVTFQVNLMVSQLIGALPKKKYAGSETNITQTLKNYINSRIGCLAILELSKNPIYADMIPHNYLSIAANGSKSEQQKAFEEQHIKALETIGKQEGEAFMKRFWFNKIYDDEKARQNASESFFTVEE